MLDAHSHRLTALSDSIPRTRSRKAGIKAKVAWLLAASAFCLAAPGCGGGASDQGGTPATTEQDYTLYPPRVPGWNHVCTGDAIMWSKPYYRGTAIDLCGTDCFPDTPVYVWDTQYGDGSAHSAAIVPAIAGDPWGPGKYVYGYVNLNNLCNCPDNTPRTCSSYEGIVRGGYVY
jgi:hypothetical protein